MKENPSILVEDVDGMYSLSFARTRPKPPHNRQGQVRERWREQEVIRRWKETGYIL